MQEDDDLPYEEEIIRNPYSVKCWMRYIEHKQNAQKSVRNMIYERALKELPGRYVHVLFSLKMKPLCLEPKVDLLLFLCISQLQVVVQLPEREKETGERQMCHRSSIRGGEQLSRESTCVYA